MTEHEISRTEVSTWTVQAGSDGLWVDVSKPFTDRQKAAEILEFQESVAPKGLMYRLARDTTVWTRTIEAT